MTWPVNGFAEPPPPQVPPPLEVVVVEVVLVDPPQEIRPTDRTRTRAMTARPLANGMGV